MSRAFSRSIRSMRDLINASSPPCSAREPLIDIGYVWYVFGICSTQGFGIGKVEEVSSQGTANSVEIPSGFAVQIAGFYAPDQGAHCISVNT